MSEQQAVVDTTDAAATQAADATDSARNDGADPLDQLLAEYDQSTKKADPVSTTQTNTATQADQTALETRLRMLEQREQQNQAERFKREMSDLVNDIRGDVPKDVFDDDMIEGWLNARALKDPRLAQAFQQKDQNPRAWAKVQSELKKQLGDRWGKAPDKGATEDREAVAAAVRGASTKVTAEPQPKFGQQTNAEFRKTVREQYGFDPGV